jgi:hypothetical protein
LLLVQFEDCAPSHSAFGFGKATGIAHRIDVSNQDLEYLGCMKPVTIEASL